MLALGKEISYLMQLLLVPTELEADFYEPILLFAPIW